MTRRNPREAGARLERAVATDLRRWLGPGWTVLRNQPGMQRGEAAQPGEFSVQRIADDADGPLAFPLAVECKAALSFTALQLWAPTRQVVAWWAQAVKQAGTTHVPLLVCTGRHREAQREPVLAIARPHLWRDLGLMLGHRLHLAGDEVEAVPWERVTAVPATMLAEVTR